MCGKMSTDVAMQLYVEELQQVWTSYVYSVIMSRSMINNINLSQFLLFMYMYCMMYDDKKTHIPVSCPIRNLHCFLISFLYIQVVYEENHSSFQTITYLNDCSRLLLHPIIMYLHVDGGNYASN